MQSGSMHAPTTPDPASVAGAVRKESTSASLEWGVFEQLPLFAEATMEAITSTTSHLCQGVAKAANHARRSFLSSGNVPSA
jgi:hypothetical protein